MNFHDHERAHPKLNIAPLIDVVFLLLVFFMLASTFIQPAAIDLSIPGAPSTAKSSVEILTVDVRLNGEVRLNGLLLPLDRLGSELSARVEGDLDTPVAVRAEARVPVQRLVSVMDRIQSVGLSNIRLAAPRRE